MKFHLCEEGKRLYLLWSEKCETKAKDKNEAKKAYYDHRKDCRECTKAGEE